LKRRTALVPGIGGTYDAAIVSTLESEEGGH